MLSEPGRLAYDPVARRRVRRWSARLRPLLLPAALLVSSIVVADRLLAGPVAPPLAPATAAAAAPDGRVLVVVSPADPAILDLAVPGAVVDVWGPGEPAVPGVDAAVPVTARLLAASALVVDTGVGRTAVPDPAGLMGAGPAGTAAVTLAVTDVEASALAAQQGRGLMLAVRPGASAAPSPGGTGQAETGQSDEPP